MDLTHSYTECRRTLRRRAQGKSLRELAAELGYPPHKAAMLSHILNHKPEHISQRSLTDLRKRLGIGRRHKRKNISVSQEAFERANAMRGRKQWDEWITRG